MSKTELPTIPTQRFNLNSMTEFHEFPSVDNLILRIREMSVFGGEENTKLGIKELEYLEIEYGVQVIKRSFFIFERNRQMMLGTVVPKIEIKDLKNLEESDLSLEDYLLVDELLCKLLRYVNDRRKDGKSFLYDLSRSQFCFMENNGQKRIELFDVDPFLALAYDNEYEKKTAMFFTFASITVSILLKCLSESQRGRLKSPKLFASVTKKIEEHFVLSFTSVHSHLKELKI